MKIGEVRRILKEDLSGKGDLPGWLDPFLTILNQFIDSVGAALLGRLTLSDNFYCKEFVVAMTSGTAQKLNPGSNVKVIGLFVSDVSGRTLSKQKWSRNDDGTVNVTLTWDESDKANVRLYLLLG